MHKKESNPRGIQGLRARGKAEYVWRGLRRVIWVRRMPVVSVVAMLFALASSVTKITALKGHYPELVCLGFGPGV